MSEEDIMLFFDLEECQEDSLYHTDAAEMLLRNRLEVIEMIYVREQGRAARATVVCPQCHTHQIATACSDVGGVWVYCENCGMLDE